jgi:hypothetical protein
MGKSQGSTEISLKDEPKRGKHAKGMQQEKCIRITNYGQTVCKSRDRIRSHWTGVSCNRKFECSIWFILLLLPSLSLLLSLSFSPLCHSLALLSHLFDKTNPQHQRFRVHAHFGRRITTIGRHRFRRLTPSLSIARSPFAYCSICVLPISLFRLAH